MTEQEWLACTDTPGRMVRFLRKSFPVNRRPSYRRKLRLLAWDGCVRLENLVARRLKREVAEAARLILPVVERLAEGRASKEEVGRARDRAVAINQNPHSRQYAFRHALSSAIRSNAWEAALGILDAGYWAAYDGEERREDYLLSRCLAVRELIGNPFRPPPARTFPAGVRGLAEACEEGDHSLYPVLADALEDLDETEAAGHCRRGGHLKGCHVVDWILGKR